MVVALTGSICGGIIKESEFNRIAKNPQSLYSIMMAFVMPDKQYKKYYKLKDDGKDKEATKLFEKYAWSII